MAGDDDLRIGSQEREDALAALASHHEAGRLDAFEYEDRRGRAADAVTRSDLTALFTDLPEPRPAFLSNPPAKAGRVTTPPARTPSPAPQARSGGRVGRTLVSLSPFIAIAAFFLTRSWLAFLLIPVIAIIAKALDDD
ncbi:DUF1707 domain-containing protein [Intrasporangium sp. YIM S08009]|uniref:DUF1707 SHOCT-like domain-containing protein n=1 Tax=Intrasporangium zincisolvens TaxID=3080018 RepID=UPI002B054635|nr:DUF1707 domain-containing protein [Intrasporangium sp. YIM S08009]